MFQIGNIVHEVTEREGKNSKIGILSTAYIKVKDLQKDR